MRIRTVAGLVIAGTAAVAGIAGTGAYAADNRDTEPNVRIVTDERGNSADKDCPDGASTTEAEL